MRILVTGATGFVGSSLVNHLLSGNRHQVRASTRRLDRAFPAEVEVVGVGDLTGDEDWSAAVHDVDVVVHLAARVHVMRENSCDPLREFRRANVAGTLNLARQAAASGVRRFVYVSSIKIHGEGGASPYREADRPAPRDDYAISKNEAEKGLRALAACLGMEVTIVRPPLVYGPAVKANFRSLMAAVSRGLVLPLGRVRNHRSLVYVENLVDLIVTCAEHPAAADETFLVSDGLDLSTTELIRGLARAMGRPARLVPVPPFVLAGCAGAIGKRDVAQRLLGSLTADISKARDLLGWSPPTSVLQGLRETTRAFLA